MVASSKAKVESSSHLLSVETGAKASAAEKERLRRYSRGDGNASKGVKKHRLKVNIKRTEKKISLAEKRAAQAERLLPTEPGGLEAEGEMEKTVRFSQHQIASALDLQSQAKSYNMKLEKLGPYRASYSADGQHLLLGGRKGHIAVVQWNGCRIRHEIQLGETVRDLCFLRDHTMFAVAQHKNLYIYDGTGTELHCLRNHTPEVSRLAYLRYHWLLATVGSAGRLRCAASSILCATLAARVPIGQAAIAGISTCQWVPMWQTYPRGWGRARACALTHGTE